MIANKEHLHLIVEGLHLRQAKAETNAMRMAKAIDPIAPERELNTAMRTEAATISSCKKLIEDFNYKIETIVTAEKAES